MSARVTLLVVDDEPLLRLAMQDALADGGYEVRAAANGADALAALDDPATVYSGLVTDIRLGGGINGWDVARRARERNPAICVVYVTGHGAAEWPVEGVPKSVVLQKPVAEAQLVTAVSTLLNEQSSAIPPGAS